MAGLRNTLQIRATQTQSQILTPQMQQAIRLLQLSTIELQQQIRQTVDSNPMLELDDSDMSSMEESYEDMLDSENENDSDYDPFSDDSSVNNASIDDEKSLLDILGDGSINLDTKKNHEDEVYDSEHEHDSDNYSEQNLAEDNQYSDKDSSLQSNSQTEENQYSAEVKGSKGLAIENDDIYEGETTETLHDHLIFQLEMSPLDGIDKKIAEAIIDGIDDSGYLKESLEDILDCIKTQDPTVTIEDVNAVLKLVQHYDPLGVGARSVQECILIQLKAYFLLSNILNLLSIIRFHYIAFPIRYAACNRACEIVRLAHQERRVLVVIDERHLHKYRWHIGVPEYKQLRHILHAAIYGAETVDDLRLDALRKMLSRTATETLNLRTLCRRIRRVTMDGHKDVSAPLIGRLRDRRSLPICILATSCRCRREIVALHDLTLASSGFKISRDPCANFCRHIALAQARMRIDRAAVVCRIMSRINEYLHLFFPPPLSIHRYHHTGMFIFSPPFILILAFIFLLIVRPVYTVFYSFQRF